MNLRNNADENKIDDLKIRTVSPSDINRLYYIEIHSFKSPFSLETLEKLAQIPNIIYLVAEIKQFIVGYTITSLRSTEAHIISIVIDKDYRRRGIGSILLNKTIEKLHEKNMKKLILEVRVSNDAAIAFYEKYNFKSIKTKISYYSDGEDALEMEKIL
ncbi:MAG: ribosomal protein S18-alanine N-acetyltransferase [Promethearchaeota archaeon]